MIYNTPKELMLEIRHQMKLMDVNISEVAIKMGKKQQNVSQLFSVSNPKLSSLFEVCDALGLDIDINFIIE